MKRIISLLMITVLLFSNGLSVKAEDKYPLGVQKKIELKKVADNNRSNVMISDDYEEEKIELISSLSVDPNVDRDSVIEELKLYGVYILEDSNENNQISMLASDNSSIQMNKPTVGYDSMTKDWFVSGGGYWKYNTWMNDVSLNSFLGYVGETKNLGAKDCFGVGYTNLSGKYSSHVTSSYAYITNGKSGSDRILVSTTNRSDGDGSKGFGFELQDYVRIDKLSLVINPSEYSYVGKDFFAIVHYDSSFTYLHGNATTYYIHTYNKAEVSGVNFGVNGNVAGVSATIINSQDSFKAYSNDTQF